jgi:CRISPR-associated protein Cas1
MYAFRTNTDLVERGACVYRMVHAKVMKLALNDYGSYLGRAEGCFEVREKNGNKTRYPHFEKEIGEAVLKSGNYVSVDALIDLALWNIDTYIMTRKNRVVAVLKNLEDDSHVKTRIAQYQSLDNGKGANIAKQIVTSKIEGQNIVLNKYGLKTHRPDFSGIHTTDLNMLRRQLLHIEGKHSDSYFSQIFQLFPENIRPTNRRTFKAYDGINNVFNFGYYVLKCRVHKALLKAKLEPYLGFLHSLKYGTPGLVCDFMELYRYLIDDLLIERCQKLHKNDFVVVTDFMMRLRMGKRIHLCDYETDELADALNQLFTHIVEVPRIMRGERQEIETLICEEALLFAKYLRGEKPTWNPRIVELSNSVEEKEAKTYAREFR